MTENSAITTYFKKIGNIPLLTKDQEQALFERIERGDAKARDELIERNLKLVIPTAKRYAKCGIPFADLIQEGSLAVAKACDKFDRKMGNKFSTYATYWIQQRIGRYVKKHMKNVFVPEHIVNLAVQINKVKRVLAQDGIEVPTDEQLVSGLKRDFGVDADEKTVRETVEFCQGETSMSAKVGDDGDTEFGELLADTSAKDPAEDVDAAAARKCVDDAVSGLSPFERTLLDLRYGIGRNGMTVSEIAELTGTEAGTVEAAAEFSLGRMRAGKSEAVQEVAA